MQPEYSEIAVFKYNLLRNGVCLIDLPAAHNSVFEDEALYWGQRPLKEWRISGCGGSADKIQHSFLNTYPFPYFMLYRQNLWQILKSAWMHCWQFQQWSYQSFYHPFHEMSAGKNLSYNQLK